jgi:hypothetical protein
MARSRNSIWQRGADRLGVGAAWLCALHCAAWPLLLALLPALGAWHLGHIEQGFVAFAAVLGLGSLITGFRRHRTFRAFWFLLPGLCLLLIGAFTEVHEDVVWHAVLMTAGGTLVGLAHLVNLRLSHGHVHDASCGHLPTGHSLAPATATPVVPVEPDHRAA